MNGVDGLISGLPTGELIDATLAAARAPTVLVEQKKALAEARLEAVRTLNLRMLSARLDVGSLRRESTFGGVEATSSKESAVTAKASSTAVAGTYRFSVDRLASAEQRATAGQASATQTNGSGQLTLQIGNGATTTLEFSSGASSLQDIAKAINRAGAGLTAFVIDDGSGGGAGKRLVMQSVETGASSAISLSASGDTSFTNIFGTDGSAMEVLAAGEDALLTLGTGAGAIQITSASNTVDSVVPGVQLQLHETAANLSINVAADASGARAAIDGVVESINSALSYFRDNSRYDVGSREAGILFSESDLRTGIGGLRTALLGGVPGLQNGFSNLASIGITFNERTGQLSVDEAALDAALRDDPAAVRKLFVNSGTSSDIGVEFVSLREKTDLSGSFTVDITQAAQQARIASAGSLAGTTQIVSGSNDALEIAVNGKVYNLRLAAGSYTPAALAEHLQALADSSIGRRGNAVNVELAGDGSLDLRTARYGAKMSIAVNSQSNAFSLLKLQAGSFTGVDVAGSINGQAATGQGQTLTGVAGSASEGLSLLITAAAPVSGVMVQASKGLAQAIYEQLGSLTDSVDGIFARKQDFIEVSIEGMDERIKRADEVLVLRRQRLEAQYLGMEKLLAQFQNTERFLTGQIEAFANLAASKRGRR